MEVKKLNSLFLNLNYLKMKKTIFLLGISFFSFYCFGQSTDSNRSPKVQEEGKGMSSVLEQDADMKSHLSDLFERARSGDSQALLQLGKLYKSNALGKPNYKKAFFYLSKAATQGVGQAWAEIGVLFKYGMGRPLDYQQAYRCFEKAASLNAPIGVYSQAYMQFKGLGCTQDYGKAVEGFKRAAELGNKPSLYMLGICYRNGYGVEKDPVKATYWLRQAEDKGYGAADVELQAEIPEYNPISASLVQKVEAAERISEKIDYSINTFNKVKPTFGAASVDGDFSGYLIKYDWSGSMVLSATSVKLTLNVENGDLNGYWSEEGRDDHLKINGKLENGKVVFSDMNFKMPDHYHKDSPLVYRFDAAELELFEKNGEFFLAGSLDLYVPALVEPQKPHTLILSKDSNASIDADQLNNNNDNTISILTAYPNPFESNINIEFTLKTEGKTSLKVRSLDGRLVYEIPAQNLDQGTYIVPINIDVSSGTYVISIEKGKRAVRTIKVVKP